MNRERRFDDSALIFWNGARTPREAQGNGRASPLKRPVSERRRYSRVSSRLTTVFTVYGTNTRRRAFTRDIGGAGVCFILDERLRPGALLDAQLKLPDRERLIAFIGEVVWNRPASEGHTGDQDPKMWVGVRFVKIHPRDRLGIVHFTKMSVLSDQF